MKLFVTLSFLLPFSFLKAQRSTSNIYNGNDLGLTYSKVRSVFRVWSPTATAAELRLYENGAGGEAVSVQNMKRSTGGTWVINIPGDLKGKYYTYRMKVNGSWNNEVVDPYAKAAGVNGRRAQVIDLDDTDPQGWQNDRSPKFINKTDAIIYELHVRDASIAANSGITNKGKFLGLTEKGTKNSAGLSTGIDHIRELGVTHVHLLPSYDYNSVDESKQNSTQYNWGYDPLNYNIPEGSYSTDPYDGAVRITEFKKLIQTFHQNGLRVVMDVVYNHTAQSETSNFSQLVPGYYYRFTKDGKFSNATACGNETASEKAMMRKFILESMIYWVKEYHIDGFRIDLMGVHDIKTMNLISKELHKIRPDILLYGEGWTAGSSTLADSMRALKKYAYKLDRIAVFSDDVRDGIKGSVFDHQDRGFVSGKPGMEESIKFGVVASLPHSQLNYKKVNYSKAPYSKHPHHTVTYAECHDNHVLWDKLKVSMADASEADRLEAYKLALTIVLTSQGIAFLHAGGEFVRTKQGVENSFESPDSINAIDWDLKTKNQAVFEYVKKLIALRKAHPAFRMTSAETVRKAISFHDQSDGVVSYEINGTLAKDSWNKIFVIFNGNETTREVMLPTGQWSVEILNNQFANGIVSGKIKVAPRSSVVVFR